MTLPSTDIPSVAVPSPHQDALFNAVSNNRVEEVQALLALPPDRRPDPLMANGHGNTALMLAVWDGYDALLPILLPVSNPDQQDRYGRNALMVAAAQRRPGCVRALLPLTDLAAVDPQGDTVLMFAIRGMDPDVVRQLLVHGLNNGPRSLDPMAYNAAGKDALVLSSVDGSHATTQLLVEHVPALAQRLVQTLPERPLQSESWLAWALHSHQETLFGMLLAVSDPLQANAHGESPWSLARTDATLPRTMLDRMAQQVPYPIAEALWNESTPEEREALPHLAVRREQTELRRMLNEMGETIGQPRPERSRSRL